MRPNGDFVVGVSAVVIVVLAVIGGIVFNATDNRKAELEFSKHCQSQGKEVQYRETGRAIYSECK